MSCLELQSPTGATLGIVVDSAIEMWLLGRYNMHIIFCFGYQLFPTTASLWRFHRNVSFLTIIATRPPLVGLFLKTLDVHACCVASIYASGLLAYCSLAGLQLCRWAELRYSRHVGALLLICLRSHRIFCSVYLMSINSTSFLLDIFLTKFQTDFRGRDFMIVLRCWWSVKNPKSKACDTPLMKLKVLCCLFQI